jgi:branched-chain amino acid transport system substrate-binding protein
MMMINATVNYVRIDRQRFCFFGGEKLNQYKIIRSWLFWVLFLFTCILGLVLIVFIKNKPILIGFTSQLTGRQAELGVQERNGVQLRIEEINASGGIAGRKIKLIERDDYGIPEKAYYADRELVRAGVSAIIGHSTSELTMAGLKATNPAHVVMLGPTISTPKLSRIDDYFFRVYPSFQDSASAFAEYIYYQGLQRMAILFDTDNAAYVSSYRTAFAAKYKSLGGIITSSVGFSSVKHPDFSLLLMKLHECQPAGLLIIASDIDTALIAQQTRLLNWKIPLFTSAWAQTDTLIINGGKAVEGLMLEQSYVLANHSPKFLEFSLRYRARFGGNPSFGAAFGYEAASVLALALVKCQDNVKEIRQALLSIHDFPGVMGPFSFDRYGDVDRPFYLSSIRNGKFIVLKKLTSTLHGGL